jgi:Arc/MetJ family transcription regulator
MRTTVELPDSLLRQAMQAAHVKTKTEAITLALEELVRKSQGSALNKYKGKIDLDVNLDELRGR